MATYVLIHGAGADSWYWHRVAPKLRDRGHEVIAPDLPCDDDSAGLEEYAKAVVDATGTQEDVIVVAQSLGGFVAPIVASRTPTRLIVLVTAMVPRAGESPAAWFENTGWADARRADAEASGRAGGEQVDVLEEFFHDVPKDVVAEAFRRGERKQSDTPFSQPWPLTSWPDLPTRFVLCRNDRFFPAPLMRRVVRERLRLTPDEIDSGHLPALAQPGVLTDRLESYRNELVGRP